MRQYRSGCLKLSRIVMQHYVHSSFVLSKTRMSERIQVKLLDEFLVVKQCRWHTVSVLNFCPSSRLATSDTTYSMFDAHSISQLLGTLFSNPCAGRNDTSPPASSPRAEEAIMHQASGSPRQASFTTNSDRASGHETPTADFVNK